MSIIRMETEEVLTAAQKLDWMVMELSEDSQKLKKAARSLRNAWHGSLAQSYAAELEQKARTLDAEITNLQHLAQSLRSEEDEWMQVDQRGRDRILEWRSKIEDDQERRLLEEWLIHPDKRQDKSYIIDTDKYDPFNLPDQYDQKGGNCILYGLLHLALMNGKSLSQGEIDALIDKYRPWWLPDDKGIPTFWIDDILRDLGLKFNRDGFNIFQSIESGILSGGDGLTYDIKPMQDKLVEQLKNGEPVYVITDSEIFGYKNGEGGHAYNVIGANVDDQGNLISVIVDTNWDFPNPMTIEGADFLRDWAQEGCQMITIDNSGGN